jgi:hypothetical protein
MTALSHTQAETAGDRERPGFVTTRSFRMVEIQMVSAVPKDPTEMRAASVHCSATWTSQNRDADIEIGKAVAVRRFEATIFLS